MQTTISTTSLDEKPHPPDMETTPPNPSGSPMPPTASLSSTQPTPPPEVEATLTKLTSHKNVIGCLVLSRPEGLIIRSGGSLFDPSGPGARERAERLRRIVRMVRNVNDSLTKEVEMVGQGKKKEGDDSDDSTDEKDELGFVRIRTKKYEMMISPSEKYLLAVLQDPSIAP